MITIIQMAALILSMSTQAVIQGNYELGTSGSSENFSRLTLTARIVPSFKNGKPEGLKLFSIRPGSLYAKLGFKNGDAIKRINGMDLFTPDQALSAYVKLKTADKIIVDLSRRGAEKTFTYFMK